MKKNKIALVTGATKGIGRAIAEVLAKEKITVIGTATNQENANIITNYLNNIGIGKGIILDVTNFENMKKILNDIYVKFGDIDILINNAGIINDNLILRMKKNEWEKIIDVNLTSVFYLSKIILRNMIKKNSGRIIFIGSVVGNTGNIGQANYAAAKAGLIGFSKSLSREVASRGITVNIVAPGFIETDMTNVLSKKQKELILEKIPIGRFGKANEIASVVAFLTSEKASYITGETLHVNGGMYMS